MAQIYDISMKITNELPCIKITDDLVVTVNNRKSTILNIQAMQKQMELEEKKAAESGEVREDDGMNFMTKSLEQLIGAKNVKEIEAIDLPLPEYKEVFQTVMSVATGTYGETPSK